MNVFYGSAIQGAPTRGMRNAINTAILKSIASGGCTVLAEHTTGRTREEVNALLDAAIGPLPPVGPERMKYVRSKMIESIESPNLDAAIFEVSLPSTGTGIEVAHAYLRPSIGLSAIPVLLLYEKDYWINGLSLMIKGLPFKDLPNVQLAEYGNVAELKKLVRQFLASIHPH